MKAISSNSHRFWMGQNLIVSGGQRLSWGNWGGVTVFDYERLVLSQKVHGFADASEVLVFDPEKRIPSWRARREFSKAQYTKDRLLRPAGPIVVAKMVGASSIPVSS